MYNNIKLFLNNIYKDIILLKNVIEETSTLAIGVFGVVKNEQLLDAMISNEIMNKHEVMSAYSINGMKWESLPTKRPKIKTENAILYADNKGKCKNCGG